MDLHELKLQLQRHFSDGLLTIVGSGLSCEEGLPGMTELASYLQTVIGGGLTPADADQWAKLGPLISEKGFETALLEITPTPALEMEIVDQTARLIANFEQKIISQVFARKKTLSFTRLLSHLLKPQTGLPVVTTNYDRLVEIAVEEAGLGVDTMFIGHFAGSLNEHESRLSFCREVRLRGKQVQYHYRPRVNVFKPHGSLDWYHREGKPVRYSGDLSLPRLIITPGINKFRNGYESPFDRHRDRANSAIDRATRFLIIGYGFNDDHLETHLTPRIRSGIPTLLLTRSLSSNALKLTSECSNVVAIQRAVVSGKEGSSFYMNKAEFQIADLTWWKLIWWGVLSSPFCNFV